MRSFARSIFEAIDIRPRRSIGGSIGMLFVGLAVGAAGAVLLTPRTGAEMREELSDQAGRLIQAGKGRWASMRDGVKQLAHQAEEKMASMASDLGRVTNQGQPRRLPPSNGSA